MTAYDHFAKFYDAAMGDRTRAADRLRRLIRKVRPDAVSVLELGCGTGSMLKYLQDDYAVSGLDMSGAMLSIARGKVPKARLFQQDMVDFAVPDHYDVICCVFDSLNHVRTFSGWKSVFARVRRHLSPRGCFIFDINTQRKLERHIAEPPWVCPFKNNLLIMNVTKLPRGLSNWNVKVFEHLNGDRFVLHQEDIVEASFPRQRIAAALSACFKTVSVIDPDRKRPSAMSERLFWTAAT